MTALAYTPIPPAHTGASDLSVAIPCHLIGCSTLPGKRIDTLRITPNLAACAILVVRTDKQWIHLAHKNDIICKRCGLRHHDDDASRCKSSGHVISQTYFHGN